MTKEIKITEKTSKQELVNVLKGAKVSEKNLGERVKYALDMFAKDMTKVTKADLFELAQEVIKSLTPAPAPVEASLKPKSKLGAKKSETKPETKEETAETEKKEEKPKSPKGKTAAKADKPKDGIETLPPASNVGVDNLPSAKIFPKEIEHPELGKLIACTGAYTAYAEVMKAIEEEKTLYFACYWTKRQIKEFSYAASKMIDPNLVKNGFPNDLDILMAVLPCETMERVFAMSRITEALFQFEGDDFKPVEDTDPRSGDKFQIRVSAGMEFEIYRPADEEI